MSDDRNVDKERQKQRLPEYLTYKYSDNKRCPLHESIILAGISVFIKYVGGETIVVGRIEENSRIIRPPRKEEYPYEPYEFVSLDEIETYVHRAKTETFDSLFFTARSIVEKFNDQDEVIIIALATDIIWSYYQDLFATTHYDNITGNNETGKSSIGYTFAFAGYRPVKATSISAANYYRMLGTIEPGQCTFIEDEADNIEEDSDKMKILKAGYEYTAKVPKINMNSPDQKQNWFCSYCFKMIISEKPLDPKKAKGLIERTFKYRCQQGDDDIIFSIKEVITNPFGDPVKQKLFDELLDFRKLMLCHRLIHYRDHFPDIDTGFKNRDKELAGPLLQLFQGTKVFSEIKYALEIFLTQRKEKKSNTFESTVLQPLILNILAKNNNTSELYLEQIWDALVNHIPGKYDPRKRGEYQSKEYGTIYRNTISQKIVEEFGAVRKRKNDGTILIFDQEKLKQFQTSYDENAAFKVEARKDISGDESEGSESSEGSNECGCAAIQVYQNGKIEVFRYIPIDNNICNVQNKVESEIAPITADVDDAKGSLLADKKNSLQGLLLSCAFCDSYKADNAVDMELHVLRKHKQELELLSMGKDIFSKEKNSMIKTS